MSGIIVVTMCHFLHQCAITAIDKSLSKHVCACLCKGGRGVGGWSGVGG